MYQLKPDFPAKLSYHNSYFILKSNMSSFYILFPSYLGVFVLMYWFVCELLPSFCFIRTQKNGSHKNMNKHKRYRSWESLRVSVENQEMKGSKWEWLEDAKEKQMKCQVIPKNLMTTWCKYVNRLYKLVRACKITMMLANPFSSSFLWVNALAGSRYYLSSLRTVLCGFS